MKGHKWKDCPCGKVHGKYVSSMKDKTHTEETKEVMSEKRTEAWKDDEYAEKVVNTLTSLRRNPSYREEMSEILKIGWENPDSKYHSEECKEKRRKSLRVHDVKVLEELEKLEQEGFRCIPLNCMPIPDIIAIKDGKIFAVEVGKNVSSIRKRENYVKYHAEKYYDEMIWVRI